MPKYELHPQVAELSQTRKLLEVPAKRPGWVKRFWVGAALVALVVAFLSLPIVSIAEKPGGPKEVPPWRRTDPASKADQKALVGALHSLKGPLYGLKGVNVLLEEINPQAERLGLREDLIKTDVELRLRKAGIRVLTDKEMLETPGKPYLYVTVGTYINLDITAVSINVELRERVTLARGFEAGGAIWDKRTLGTVATRNIGEIRESVGDVVDKFINDYLAANPR